MTNPQMERKKRQKKTMGYKHSKQNDVQYLKGEGQNNVSACFLKTNTDV